MENMLESFNDYDPMKNVYNHQKVNILLNTGNFIKDKEKFSLLLKKICFHCLNHMCLMKMNGKKKILMIKNICQKLLSYFFLQKHDQASLYKKENELLNRDIGYKNIDELVLAFNNAKTNEELTKCLI